MYNATNNVSGITLAIAINELSTSFTISGNVELLPAENGKITLTQYSSGNVVKREIVTYTTRTGTSVTGVSRAFEPVALNDSATTLTQVAQTFDIGTQVNLAVTAFDINQLQTLLPKSGGTMTGQIKGAWASIASAGTVNLSSLNGNYVEITGTTTITSFGSGTAGTTIQVKFAGSLVLTYNATSLILPTLANITTSAGDTATFISEGGSNWRCTQFTRASGESLIALASGRTQSTYVAGENITANEPLYISNGTGARTSGRVYKTILNSVSITDGWKFVGFAQSTVSTGSNVVVSTSGIHTGMSGLTVGAPYYLSGTAGQLVTTPTDNAVLAGIAQSSTTMLISTADSYAQYYRNNGLYLYKDKPTTLPTSLNVTHGMGIAPRLVKMTVSVAGLPVSGSVLSTVVSSGTWKNGTYATWRYDLSSGNPPTVTGINATSTARIVSFNYPHSITTSAFDFLVTISAVTATQIQFAITRSAGASATQDLIFEIEYGF